MARAAGNDSHYTWELRGRPGLADISLPSVTSIIKGVMGGSFSSAAYWGFKLGVRAAFPDVTDEEFEKTYEDAKGSEHAPNRVRNSAAGRGTSTHEYLERLVEAAPDGAYPEPTTGYERAVWKWWADKNPMVIHTEIPVLSLKEGFAGTVDLVTDEAVIDLKTHKGSARLEDFLQVSAYDLAGQEMGLWGADKDHVVLLAREDGKYTQSSKWTDPNAFLAIKRVYDEMGGK